MVWTPVLPAEVHDDHWEQSEDDRVWYDDQAVDVAEQLLLRHDPTSLPLFSSQ